MLPKHAPHKSPCKLTDELLRPHKLKFIQSAFASDITEVRVFPEKIIVGSKLKSQQNCTSLAGKSKMEANLNYESVPGKYLY